MRTNKNIKSGTRLAAVAIFATLVIVGYLPTASAQTSADLGTADPFAILAGSAVTNTGPSVIDGDIGVHPGSSVTGFEDATVNGDMHVADAVAEQAKVDLTTAYNDAAGRTPDAELATELGNQVLLPGVYDSASGTFGLTGSVTLDAQEDPGAVWIFQMASTLTTATDSSVALINGAQACNVFWQVGSSATLGTRTDFKGNIMAEASITMGNGATLDGRALARTEAVTLDTNVITAAECALQEEPPAEEPPAEDPPAEDPPAEDPPAEDPPAEDPPAEDPPAEDPPAEDPPAEDPPAEDPPAEDPPAEDPPAEDPPAEDPPTEDPPAEDPPAEDPPAEDPSLECSTGLMATANEDSSITLTWTSVEGAEQYRIYRATGDDASTLHDEVDGDATSFIDTDTEVGAAYRYEVRPVNAGVESEDCDTLEVTAIPFFPGLVAASLAIVGGTTAYALIRRRT